MPSSNGESPWEGSLRTQSVKVRTGPPGNHVRNHSCRQRHAEKVPEGLDQTLHRKELICIEVKNQSRQMGTILHRKPDTLWKGGLGFPVALRADADMGKMVYNNQ